MGAHEADRLLDRAPRDAGVDCGLNDLRDGAVRARALAAEIGGDDRLGSDANIVDEDVAARRGALAEARPAVDDREPGSVARRDRQIDIAVFADCADVDEMGEQGAGRIEFLAVDDEGIAVAPQCRLERPTCLLLASEKALPRR